MILLINILQLKKKKIKFFCNNNNKKIQLLLLIIQKVKILVFKIKISLHCRMKLIK